MVQATSAQNNRIITGRVISSNSKAAISEVSVRIKGTSTGVITDGKGNYSIDLKGTSPTLVFSHIGFVPQEIKINSKLVINVTLKPTGTTLDEVVVIGYGEVKRRDLTGAVGSVKMADMQKAPVISFEEALAGRVAGVRVSSADGQPGAEINVVIRGNNSVTQDNSPLYVIDGFPQEAGDNNAINPAEIESIEVLKDASSTAIYGARGANGVIIITTKKGKPGPPVINYNGYYGFMENARRMKMMDGYEFVKYQFEMDSANANAVYLVDGKTLEDFRDEKGTDLQDEVFHISPFQNHFISLAGGNAKTRYTISGSILNQDGIIKNSGYDRYQGRITLDQTVNSNIKVGINTNYSVLHKYGTSPSLDANTGYFHGDLLYAILQYRPIAGNVSLDEPIEDQDEEFISMGNFNPIKTVENELRESNSDILSANIYGEYSIGKYLKLRVTGGLTKSKAQTDRFDGSQTRRGSSLTSTGQNIGISGSINIHERSSFLNENTLTFNKTFNKVHAVNLLAGFTLQKTTVSSFGTNANQLPNEALGLAGLDEGTPTKITSSSSLFTLASFLGRANYSYRSKYLMTASLRADGSSKFSKENKWSYFQSGALAWRIDEENFMKSLTFISEAKIRVSYGMTGNNRVSDFAYLSRISLPATAGYSYNNSRVNIATLTELGNPHLRWEKTTQTDLGLDLGFFKQRVTLTADIYRKITSDLLLNAKVPNSIGFVDAFKNIGEVQNQGLELTLNTINVKNKNFSWNSNFNISFNKNKVLALAENQTQLFTIATWTIATKNVPLYIAEINQPVARFYGYIWEGNYQYADFDETSPGVYVLKNSVASYNENRSRTRPGDIKFRDINGDGLVNSDDKTIIGDPNPEFSGGFSNNFTFQNFDLNVFMQFSVGNDVLNANRIVFEGDGRANQNMFATYINRWTPENQNNDYYRTNGSGPSDAGYSTRVVEDGSYLRLKTVSLGYNFTPKLLNKIKLKTFRVYVSAQNLLTFTDYQGYDPEVSRFGNSPLRPGFDYSVYPRSRTITFGANISL